jgi:hypothetical protein
MTQEFYDALAPYYHLLYPNWDASIRRQGRGLAHVLNEFAVPPGFATVARRDEYFFQPLVVAINAAAR